MTISKWMATMRPGGGVQFRPHFSLMSAFVGFFSRLALLLLDWQGRANERHFLAALDDRALADMGLSRADVMRETAKPFWRA